MGTLRDGTRAIGMGNQIRLISFILAAAVAYACGSSSTAKKPDAKVDAFSSTCGQPGDLGNELGVGKFCNDLADCMSTPSARLCSIIGDPTTHVCTKTCAGSGSAGSGMCGTAASCTCDTSSPPQCGCVPNSCLM